MNAARRSIRRRQWARGLYEPRPGYFVWRHPETGAQYTLGRISFAEANSQALAANIKVAGAKPTLLDMLDGADNTVADLIKKMPTEGAKNTEKTRRYLDRLIVEAVGAVACRSLSTQLCAQPIERLIEEDKLRAAQALRSRLVALCKRGMQLGWMSTNPAEATASPRVTTRRERLTLDHFKTILERAPEVSEWLQTVMLLMIVTLQDIDTVSRLRRDQIGNGYLTVQRGKTKATNRPVAIPLDLSMKVLDVSLRGLLERRTGVVSPFIVHHVKPWGNAPVGSPVSAGRMSSAFARARDLAGLGGGEHPPSLYECKSLGVRTYKATQPEVDLKALAGHATDRMHELYADARGIEPVMVRIA